LYRELRRNHSLDHVSVVIVSGFARPGEDLAREFNRLLRDGQVREPDGYLEKPVALAEFLALVNSLVGQRERVDR